MVFRWSKVRNRYEPGRLHTTKYLCIFRYFGDMGLEVKESRRVIIAWTKVFRILLTWMMNQYGISHLCIRSCEESLRVNPRICQIVGLSCWFSLCTAIIDVAVLWHTGGVENKWDTIPSWFSRSEPAETSSHGADGINWRVRVLISNQFVSSCK